ncbi:T9SS type B sorting domain-containing protein, partial [Flavobacterium zepuense]
ITYYLDMAAYTAGTALPRMYTNTVQSHQQIVVHVVNDVTGCENVTTMDLYAEPQALANPVTQGTLDTYFDLCDTVGANDGIITFDLTQATADVIGSQTPATDYTVTYYETEADAIAGTNAIDTTVPYTNTTPYAQTIWVRIINNTTITGCPSIISFPLVVEPLSEPVITTPGNNDTVCIDFKTGSNLSTLTLDSGVAPNGHTYQWFKDGIAIPGTGTTDDSTYEALEAGSYTVQVTGPAPNFCVSQMSAPFVVLESGPASPIGQGYVVSNAFSDNQTITVLVEGYGEYQYSLDGGPWQNSNVFTNVSLGAHSVVVRDFSGAYSCGELTLNSITTIGYPHFFSPNGDSEHETWNVIGLTDHIVFIYDRYGKLIKQISSDGKGWDGTYNGRNLPASDYWFSIQLKNGDVIKGHFSLLR